MEEIEEQKEVIVVLDEGVSMEEIAETTECCKQSSAALR